ncbi:MAG: M20/M25/M40 family metallo-hydrolase [Solirubrobacterales bacterium]
MRFSADLRHEDAVGLAALAERFAALVDESSAGNGCRADSEPVFAVGPTRFDPALVALATRAAHEITGDDLQLVSGPGHDAVEMARVVPAAMLFAPSKGGISHAGDEDTPETDLRAAIAAFGELADAVLDEVAGGDARRPG